jgi:hypothetical protein
MLLDISVSGTKTAKPTTKQIISGATLEQLQDATHERIFKSPSEIVEGTRVFKDDLLVRLADKGQLWPDPKINLALRAAGEKYFADWYGAGMGGLKAIDYGKQPGGQGGSGSHLAPSRIAAQCREAYRAARAVLPECTRKVVELILLQDQSLAAVGKAVTGSAVPHTCRSVAIERFTAGLYLLAKHYVFIA